MNKKQIKIIFILISLSCLIYLVYFLATKPKEKFGQVSYNQTPTDNFKIESKPLIIGSFNRATLDKNQYEVYKITPKAPSITSTTVKDIVEILGFKNLEPQENIYEKITIFVVKERNPEKVFALYSSGQLSYILTTNLNFESNQKQIIEELNNIKITQILPIPQDFYFNTSNDENNLYFNISYKLPNTKTLHTKNSQYVYSGRIYQDTPDTPFYLELTGDLSFNILITEDTTYNIIDLKTAIDFANNNQDKIIIDVDSQYRYVSNIDTSKLNFTNADITYFIEDNLLVPYIELKGYNQFNQSDKGTVKVYVPAIKKD